MLAELPDIVQMLLALAFVIALMGGLALIAKRIIPGAAQQLQVKANHRRIKIIERLPLDPRKQLAIIECDGEEHLVILGPQSDTVIKQNLEKTAHGNDVQKAA